MAGRVYLVSGSRNIIIWNSWRSLVLAGSKVITPDNTISVTRYDNGVPVVYRPGATENPTNFTPLVRNGTYFIEVKIGYWLDDGIPHWLNKSVAPIPTQTPIPTPAPAPSLSSQYQPLNQNLSNISSLASTVFGLGFLVLESALQAREKIAALGQEDLNAAVGDLQSLIGSKQPSSDQLSAIASLSLTDFGLAILTRADAVSVRNSIGAVSAEDLQGYAQLTGDGTIPTSMLPNSSLMNISSVASAEEMLALTDVQPGDTVLRQDLPSQKLFTLIALPASELGNWEQSGIGIQTLNGQSGPVVNLGAGDIGADSLGSAELVRSLLQRHETDSSNPHEVTAAQIGAELAGASGAVAQALSLHESDTDNPHQVTVGQIGGQPQNDRLDAITTAGAGIFKVQGDALVQVPSSPIGELILNSCSGIGQLLTVDSIIFPLAAVVPISLTANTTLTKTIATGIEGRVAVDGQLLTLINTSSFWLFLPALGGMRMLPPGSSLTFIYSAELGGWTAPATLKTLTCRVFNSVEQIIPPGASLMTPVNFDTTRWDTSGGIMRDKVNNRLIAPVSGYYTFNGHCQISSGPVVGAFLRINGALVAGAYVNGNPYLSFPGSYFMAAGAWADLALRVYSATVSATVVRIAPLSPELEMRLYSLP